MLDLLSVLLVLAFFAASIGYVEGRARLQEEGRR
jgi:hypothetical protein